MPCSVVENDLYSRSSRNNVKAGNAEPVRRIYESGAETELASRAVIYVYRHNRIDDCVVYCAAVVKMHSETQVPASDNFLHQKQDILHVDLFIKVYVRHLTIDLFIIFERNADNENYVTKIDLPVAVDIAVHSASLGAVCKSGHGKTG